MFNFDHRCWTPTARGECTEKLDKYHPHCERHGVCVIRGSSNMREFCSPSDVKAGDRIVSR